VHLVVELALKLYVQVCYALNFFAEIKRYRFLLFVAGDFPGLDNLSVGC